MGISAETMQQQEAPARASEAGLVLARLNGGGRMEAIRSLRSQMRLRQPARATFLVALDEDGVTVSITDPRAALLVLGYRRDHLTVVR